MRYRVFSFILFFLGVSRAFAQPGGGGPTGGGPGGSGTTGTGPGGSDPTSVPLPNPLGTNNLVEVVNRIATWLIAVATPIVAVMVIVGAFQMLFAGGNEENFRKGKKTITYSVIGFIIVLLAKGVAAIIKAIATNTAP